MFAYHCHCANFFVTSAAIARLIRAFDHLISRKSSHSITLELDLTDLLHLPDPDVAIIVAFCSMLW